MIAPLRRRHRWMVTALAVIVPALFAWAMIARRPVPTMEHPAGADHREHAAAAGTEGEPRP